MGTDLFPLAAREAAEVEPDSRPEVLVVGAGPVGLFTALLLARRGIGVQIIEQERRLAARSYALALHPGSLGLLDPVGLAGEVLERGHRVDRVAFYEGRERCAEVDLTALTSPFPCATVLPQQVLEGLLESRFEQEGGKVQWRHRLAELHLGGGAAVAVVERLAPDTDAVEGVEVIRPSVVIGTDGSHSAVRRALRASYVEMSPAETFAVFEIAANVPPDSLPESPLHREVRVILDDRGAGALFALGGPRFRWSFQIEEAEWDEFVEPRFKRRVFDAVGEDPFPYLVRERLEKLIAARAPWFTADLGDIIWSMTVRFEHRLTGRFGQENAWLAGDAAHLASPVGIQSMNIGLREAADLARHLGRVLRGSSSLSTLDDYETAWRREWRCLFGARGHPSHTAAASAWTRRHAARIPSCIPASGDDLDALLRQIGLALPVV